MRFVSAFYFNDFLLLGAIFLFVCVSVGLIQWFRRRSPWLILLNWILPLFSMAVAGLSVGLLTGNSRVPVVGVLVPAFLSLVSGYNIYLFSTSSDHKTTASLFTVVFSLFLILGISTGADNRYQVEAADREWQQLSIRYETEMELYKLRVMKAEDLPFE